MTIGPATSLLVMLALLVSGCRGAEEQRIQTDRPQAPAKETKRVPNLIGMTQAEAEAKFLQMGGALVRAKFETSRRPHGTVIEQQPQPGERFIHSIELVISRPVEER